MKTKNVMGEETTSGEITSFCSNIYIPFCFNIEPGRTLTERMNERLNQTKMCQAQRKSTVISIANLERLGKYLGAHSLWDKSYSHRLPPISSCCQSDAWSKFALFLIERLYSIVFYFERHILCSPLNEGFTGGSRRDLHPLPFSLFFYSNFASFPVLFCVFVLYPLRFISREHERKHLFSITFHFQVERRYFASFTGKGRDQEITWDAWTLKRAVQSCDWGRPRKLSSNHDTLSMQ